jgi:hypothetical protein
MAHAGSKRISESGPWHSDELGNVSEGPETVYEDNY